MKKDMKNKDIEKIKTILNYIHNNFNKDIPINMLADMINFSTFHFIRFFKRNTGQTCTQYINAFRLEKAAKLLIDTTLSVTHIALETGFNNTSYFIKLFKVRYNFSPSNFRKNFVAYAPNYINKKDNKKLSEI
jgi:transcriptional regulator GlxA family with amidase domain